MFLSKSAVSKLHREVLKNYESATRKEFLRTQKDLKGYLEFYTTMHYLKRYLPPKGTILDAGSGPGRYTLELAKMGYSVVALDPAANSIEFVRRSAKRIGLSSKVHAQVGRIENLSAFPNEHFDAVLCLGGPLSHIMNASQRKQAIRELIRVAKRGSPIFVSVMCRPATIKGFLKIFQNEVTARYVKSYFETGDYMWPRLYGFTHFHAFAPSDFRALFKGERFKELKLVGLEGFGSYEHDDLVKLHRNKRRWNAWLKLHLMLSDEASILGASEHLLIIGRKTQT